MKAAAITMHTVRTGEISIAAARLMLSINLQVTEDLE